MGTRGPAPKRADKRLGHVAKAQKEAIDRVVVAEPPAKPPPVKADWHPIAKRWFQALGKSGQSQFYEPADWATAWMLAESMSREFSAAGPPRAASLAAWRQMMAALLVTEGDRRRAGLELRRDVLEEDADVSELAEYRRRLQSS